MRMRSVVAISLLAACAGCDKRVAEPVGVPAGTPQVSWVTVR